MSINKYHFPLPFSPRRPASRDPRYTPARALSSFAQMKTHGTNQRAIMHFHDAKSYFESGQVCVCVRVCTGGPRHVVQAGAQKNFTG